ncbi:MAG TPA: cyclodeaminase/cyclohydrolase family protein [Candidatus Baltobacteraceae bacterium]
METIDEYLEALASAQPTPGGGSAATIVAAMGAALVAMVARITLGNPKYAAKHEAARELVVEADSLRARLLAARSTDETAYGAVVTATALPRGTEIEKAMRAETLQAALARAAAAPLEAAVLCVAVLELSLRCAVLGNTNLASDVQCAAEFAHAALIAGAHNVRINDKYLTDAALVHANENRLHALEADAKRIHRLVRE